METTHEGSEYLNLVEDLLRQCGWNTYTDTRTNHRYYLTSHPPFLRADTPPWEYIVVQTYARDKARDYFSQHPVPAAFAQQTCPPPPPTERPRPIRFAPNVLPPSSRAPPTCIHTEKSWDGSFWPTEIQVQIDKNNQIDSLKRLESMWNSMDDRIFRDDKTGWSEC